MELTAVLTPAQEGGYVALNPETGTTTQGETVEEALANLTEATALYLSEFPLTSLGHSLVTMFSVLHMPKLPHVSSATVIKAHERLGFAKIRQSGSRVIMRQGSNVCRSDA